MINTYNEAVDKIGTAARHGKPKDASPKKSASARNLLDYSKTAQRANRSKQRVIEA